MIDPNNTTTWQMLGDTVSNVKTLLSNNPDLATDFKIADLNIFLMRVEKFAAEERANPAAIAFFTQDALNCINFEFENPRYPDFVQSFLGKYLQANSHYHALLSSIEKSLKKQFMEPNPAINMQINQLQIAIGQSKMPTHSFAAIRHAKLLYPSEPNMLELIQEERHHRSNPNTVNSILNQRPIKILSCILWVLCIILILFATLYCASINWVLLIVPMALLFCCLAAPAVTTAISKIHQRYETEQQIYNVQRNFSEISGPPLQLLMSLKKLLVEMEILMFRNNNEINPSYHRYLLMCILLLEDFTELNDPSKNMPTNNFLDV